MSFLNKLERKFGRYAIHNLMKYIIILFGVGLMIGTITPELSPYLYLNFPLIMKGQVWRLITFIIPISSMSTGIFFTLIAMYFYYIIGNALENTWGAFRFNLYILSGIMFNIVASLLVYLGTGYTKSPSLDLVCGTLFFAFAAIYPNTQFLMYFLIPIKAKYLAWFQGAMYIYAIVQAFLSGQFYVVIFIFAQMANFLIFYFTTRNYKRISPSEINRKAKYRRQVNEARRQSNTSQHQGRNVVTRHKCAVCGRTEIDDDQLEFRFCSKCDGNYEYCMEHLFTHEHVKR